MITPVDIEQKEFTRGVRGYKEEEVDTFLNLIILEMENLIRTNRELSDENSKLKEELATSRNTESEVLETLETAKRLKSEISANVQRFFSKMRSLMLILSDVKQDKPPKDSWTRVRA